MEEKPAGNHRRASREAGRVLPAKALDARRLPERALAVKALPVKALPAKVAVARAPLANPAEGRNAPPHGNPAEESSLFRVVRL